MVGREEIGGKRRGRVLDKRRDLASGSLPYML